MASYLSTFVLLGAGALALINRLAPGTHPKPRVEIPDFTPSDTLIKVAKASKEVKLEQAQNEMEEFREQVKNAGERLPKCGEFYFKEEEIDLMKSSLVVSYDPSIVYGHTILKILTENHQDEKTQAQGQGRMVSSLVISLRDAHGNPITRFIQNPLPYYRIYTTSAPDSRTTEGVLKHFLEEAKANKDDTLILPKFAASEDFPSDENLSEIVFEDFPSSLDRAHKEASQGKKVALLSFDHPLSGGISSYFTTLLVSQDPDCNPAIADKRFYHRKEL